MGSRRSAGFLFLSYIIEGKNKCEFVVDEVGPRWYYIKAVVNDALTTN